MTEPDPSPELVAVGKAIRALREDRGMSVAHLAAAADTAVEMVEAVEEGRDELRWDLFCALADALGVNTAAIVDRVAEEAA
jgi:XRE family transcriptional regulator, fatty acid utilization regulator